MKNGIMIGLIAVVGAAAVAGAYWYGVMQGAKQQAAAPQSAFKPAIRFPAPASQPPAEQTPAAPLRASTAMPANHPPLQATSEAAPPQAGSAGADRSAPFIHFRVGDRNVKKLVPDGDFMWVGTSGGVIRYDLKTDQYRLFDVRSGLLANGIFHLSKLDGRLLAGTYGGGMALMKPDGEGWDLYNIPDGLADAFVYDVLKAANGDLWIATWSGANRVQGGALKEASKWQTFTVENTQGGLPNDWVYGLDQGRDGTIWFATEGGLARFKDGAWQHWKHEDGLGAAYELVRDQIQFKNDPAQFSEHHARQKAEMGLEKVNVAYNPNYIVSLLVDREGIVWCGTWGGGLARFDGGAWTNFTVADGLPGNHVFMLYEDQQGRLWIGTSNGLARREDDGKYKVFTTKDGLFSDNVFAMATAADGSLWVGSFGGVARINRLP